MDHVLKCYEFVKTDIVQGRDCYLYDAHGKKYIDFEAGVWCTALGHNHPRITQTIQAQLKQIMHLGFRYTNTLTEEAAVKILHTIGLAGGKCTFLYSGSEAVEFGVQTARRLSGRPLLLALSDVFLAAHGSASRQSPDEWHCFDWSVCAACPRADECDPQCNHLNEIPFKKIGGFVFEPGSSSGLVKFPPKSLIQTLASLVKKQSGLVIIDEVTTGIGRTGAWYGFQHYDLKPDVVALGKGLGNGYPVSAVVMKRVVAEKLEDGGFRYAQSHQNDPLGCAVVKEVMTVMQEDELTERSAQVGKHFKQELEHLKDHNGVIKQVRGRGLMLGIELEKDARLSATAIFHALLERGFIVGYSPTANFLRFYPPLTITKNDIGQLVENLDHVIKLHEVKRGDSQ